MAFKKKYYFTFRDINDVQYTTEIWEDTGINIVAQEVTGDLKPFTVQYPVLDNKFNPVRGSGCTINLVSRSNMQFISLYSAKMMQYQIRHYRGSTLIWCGYLDSELYEEPLTDLENYTVTFTGTDGLALLERIQYLDSGNKLYQATATMTLKGMLDLILSKLNLPWNAMYILLSTTSTQLTIASDETILDKIYSRQDNWYNEDDDPETCRKVLEEILKPIGAFLIIDNANIFITDYNSILQTDFPTTGDIATFKKFTLNPVINRWDFLASVDMNMDLGDLSNIGFLGSNSRLTFIPGINRHTLRYSPYRRSDLIKFEADDDFLGTETTSTHGSTNHQWVETIFSDSESWTRYNNGYFSKYQGTDGENTEDSDYYLKIIPYSGVTLASITANTNRKSFKFKKSLQLIIPHDDYRLKIQMSVFPRISDDLNPENITSTIRQIRLLCRIKIGDRKLSLSGQSAPTWVPLSDPDECIFYIINRTTNYQGTPNQSGYEPMDEKWTQLKYVIIHSYSSSLTDDVVILKDFLIPIPPSSIPGGGIEFEIYHFMGVDYDLNLVTGIQDLRIKDINLTIVDARGNEIDTSDAEYVSYMDPDYSENKDSENLLGVNFTHHPCERGALLAYSGSYFYNLESFTRRGVTDMLELLLLRSIHGNYEGKTEQIVAVLNSVLSMVGYYTYINYFSQKYIIVGCDIDYSEGTTEITLQEIHRDSLTINKSF